MIWGIRLQEKLTFDGMLGCGKKLTSHLERVDLATPYISHLEYDLTTLLAEGFLGRVFCIKLYSVTLKGNLPTAVKIYQASRKESLTKRKKEV